MGVEDVRMGGFLSGLRVERRRLNIEAICLPRLYLNERLSKTKRNEGSKRALEGKESAGDIGVL